jgi:hypothetical protein
MSSFGRLDNDSKLSFFQYGQLSRQSDTKCNSAILHISSGNPQILLLRQTLDLGTECNKNKGSKKNVLVIDQSAIIISNN